MYVITNCAALALALIVFALDGPTLFAALFAVAIFTIGNITRVMVTHEWRAWRGQ